MAVAVMTSKGQVTIPAEVRAALGLHRGSRISFIATDRGTFELVPEVRSIKALKGIFAGRAAPMSLTEIEQAAADGAAEMNRR